MKHMNHGDAFGWGSARRRRQLLSFAEAEQLGVKTAESHEKSFN